MIVILHLGKKLLCSFCCSCFVQKIQVKIRKIDQILSGKNQENQENGPLHEAAHPGSVQLPKLNVSFAVICFE